MDNQSFFSKPHVQTLATIALVGVILALASYAYYTLKQSEGVYTGATVITVQGEGEVYAVPDIGTFSFSVLAEGTDANEAQSKSAESINAIVAALGEAGVEDKDIKTENYMLNPKYTYPTSVCSPNGYCPPYQEPVMDGFEVSQTITVKVRDTAQAGDLISKVGTLGATNISSLQFTVDDEGAIKAEARALAIADAKEKADQLSKDLGVRIVRMTGFWEDQGGMYPMSPSMNYAAGDMAQREVKVADMPTGENQTRVTVSITYEVK